MTSRVRPITIYSRTILRGIVLASFLIGLSGSISTGSAKPRFETTEHHAGIELSADAARAIVLRYMRDEESPGVKVIYTEVVRVALARTSSNEFDPQASKEAALAVKKLLAQLQQVYRMQDDRIYLIGSSGLGADHPTDLLDEVKKATGRTLIFLDAATDVQLCISGTIPQHEKVDDAWIDVRNSSILIEIDSNVTLAGYQMVKFLPPAPPKYEFVTMSIPYGVTSLSSEIARAQDADNNLTAFIQRTKAQGAAPFKSSLRKEFEDKPGLLTRNNVYLSGDIVRALVTLTLPAKKESFVSLTAENITAFVNKALRDPVELLNPNLSRIRDRKTRQETLKELESVRNTFTPQQIVAGAEMLKTIAAEFDFQEKKLWFARHGHLSRILSYVRLQAEK